MADFGIKISVPGKNISSTDPLDFVLHSKYASVKIVKVITGSLVVSASSSAQVTEAHGQSFIPLILFYTQLLESSGKYFLGPAKVTNGGTNDVDAGYMVINRGVDGNNNPIESWVDATNVVLSYRNFDPSNSHTVNYVILVFGDNGS